MTMNLRTAPKVGDVYFTPCLDGTAMEAIWHDSHRDWQRLLYGFACATKKAALKQLDRLERLAHGRAIVC
jgi:hypothetical protein